MGKAPSAFQIEAVVAALHKARRALSDHGLTLDEADLSEVLTAETDDAEDILARLIRSAIHCEAMAKEAHERARLLDQRSQRYDQRQNILRQQIRDLMQVLGKRRFEAGDCGCRVQAGVPRVIITDTTKIPAEYWSPPEMPTVKKLKIRQDLEAGVVIEGATLSNPEPYLVLETH